MILPLDRDHDARGGAARISLAGSRRRSRSGRPRAPRLALLHRLLHLGAREPPHAPARRDLPAESARGDPGQAAAALSAQLRDSPRSIGRFSPPAAARAPLRVGSIRLAQGEPVVALGFVPLLAWECFSLFYYGLAGSEHGPGEAEHRYRRIEPRPTGDPLPCELPPHRSGHFARHRRGAWPSPLRGGDDATPSSRSESSSRSPTS